MKWETKPQTIEDKLSHFDPKIKHAVLLNSTNRFINFGKFMDQKTLVACCQRHFGTLDLIHILSRCVLLHEDSSNRP